MADTFSFFKPPKSPLPKVEQGQLPSFVDKAFFERRFEETLKDLQDKKRDAASDDRKDELSAKIEALNLFYVQKMMEGWDGEKNEEISAEFRDFLLGKSKWNDNPRLVPWGRRKLIGDDIDAYIDSVMETKYEFDKQVNLLLNTGIIPRNLREAWIYFVYKLKNYTGKVAPDLFLKTWETFYPSPMTPQAGPQDPSKRRVLQDSEVADRLMGIREGDYPGYHDPRPPMGGIGQNPPPPPDDGEGGHEEDNGEGMDMDEEDMDTFEDPDLFPDEGEEGSQGPKGGTFFPGDYIPDEQVEKLQAQVEKGNQIVQQVTQQLAVEQGKVEQLSQLNNDLAAQLNQRLEQIKTLSEENGKLVRDAEKVTRDWGVAYQGYQKALNEKESEANTLKQQIAALMNSDLQKALLITELQQKLDQAAANHKREMEALIGQQTQFQGDYAATVANLRQQVLQMQAENRDLSQRAKELEQLLNSTKSQHMHELNKRREDEDRDREAAKNALIAEANARFELEISKLREEALKASSSDRQAIEELRARLQEKEAAVAAETSKLQEREALIARMDQAGAALQATKEELEKKIAKLEKHAIQQHEDANKQVAQAVEGQRNAFAAEKAILEEQIRRLTSKGVDEEEEFAEAEAAMASLLAEFAPNLPTEDKTLSDVIGLVQQELRHKTELSALLKVEGDKLLALQQQQEAQLRMIEEEKARFQALMNSMGSDLGKKVGENIVEVLEFDKKAAIGKNYGVSLPSGTKDRVHKEINALLRDAEQQAAVTGNPKDRRAIKRLKVNLQQYHKRGKILDQVRGKNPSISLEAPSSSSLFGDLTQQRKTGIMQFG